MSTANTTRSLAIAMLATATIAFAAGASALDPLEVKFDGCQPVEVESKDMSCNGVGPDQKNEACRNAGAIVRWVPVERIKQVYTKPGTAGSMTRCMAKSRHFQCVVHGNRGDHVEYSVESWEGCVLDPVIILK